MAGATKTTSLNFTRDLKWIRTQGITVPRLKAMKAEAQKLFKRCAGFDKNRNGKLEKNEVGSLYDWRQTVQRYRKLVKLLQSFQSPWAYQRTSLTGPEDALRFLKTLLPRVIFDMGTNADLTELNARVHARGKTLKLIVNKTVVFNKTFSADIQTVLPTVNRGWSKATYNFKVHLVGGTMINVQHTQR